MHTDSAPPPTKLNWREEVLEYYVVVVVVLGMSTRKADLYVVVVEQEHVVNHLHK